MASQSSRPFTPLNTKAPLESMDVKNYRCTARPHPTVECTVPGLAHESFDRNWMPRTSSVMWVDAITRLYAFYRPLDPQTFSHNNHSREDVSESRSELNEEQTVGDIDRSLDANAQSVGNKRWSLEDTERAFLTWGRLCKDLYGYTQYTEFTMTKALYDPDVPKWSLDFRLRLGFIGACSITNACDFYARGKDGSKILLWSDKFQLVMVDKKTRQPARIPAWFKDKYQGKGFLTQGMVVRPFDRPNLTYCHQVLVQFSDTDEYGHASWASYVRWAIDGLHAALLPASPGGIVNGKTRENHASRQPTGPGCRTKEGVALRGISREMVARGLAKFQVSYFRECVEGDQVEVHVWQDGDIDQVPCCLVKDGEEICQVKLFYFTEDDDDECL